MTDSVTSSVVRATRPSRKHRSTQSLDPVPSKRTKIAVDLGGGGYSEAEQAVLRQAAAILDIPHERLLAAAKESRHNANVPTTDTDDTLSSASDHAEDAPPECTESFTLTLPPLAKRRSRTGASSTAKLHPASQHPNDGHDICDSVLPWLSNFSDPALEIRSEFMSFSRDTNDLARPVYNQWELDLYNNANMWAGNDMESFTFLNSESTALARVPPVSATKDIPLSSNEEEAFDPLYRELSPVGPSIVPQDVAGNSNQNIEAGSSNGPSLTSSRRFEDDSLQNSEAPDRPPKRKAVSSGDADNTKIKRRGPFRDAEKRQETSLTRKLVACIRCRMQRIRVS